MTPRSAERLLPQSDEAEKAVLGAILICSDALPVARALRTEDFYRDAHKAVFRAVQRVAERGIAPDILTVGEDLKTRKAEACPHYPHCESELEHVGGYPWLSRLENGVPRSANIEHYVDIVARKARARRGIAAANSYIDAASNGTTEEDLAAYVRDFVEVVSERPQQVLRPSTLEGVANPEAGRVRYLVEGILPASELVVLGAPWKTSKTLLVYRLALDLASGRKVFGAFDANRPARVVVFQFEMPSSEDERRFRRLALGSGLDPEEVVRLAAEGWLVVYNRPPLNLTATVDVARFHDVIRGHHPALVVVDSVLSAFAFADLNDNSLVRGLLTRAFAPLTSEGTAVLLPHHLRKRQAGAKNHDKDALLGAQVFGAAAGRIYTLERLDSRMQEASEGEGETRPQRSFRVRLSLTGSWTPEDASDVVLAVEDTEDGQGTTIQVLDEAAQVAAGGLSTQQRAGCGFANLVRARRRVSRQDALTIVGAELQVSDTTLKKGLGYAQAKGWVALESRPGGRHNEQDLVPGPTLEGP